MNADFHRILTLLRKEKGISQKQAAASLGVSQALLSHYEKGIRECGLEFVVKVADFYGVSCDYLLGRSPDREGLTLNVDDIPDGDRLPTRGTGISIMPTLNKKLISNSVAIVFDLLSKGGNDSLTKECSSILMTAVYKVYRKLCDVNVQNQSTMFSIPKSRYARLCDANQYKAESKLDSLVYGQDEGDLKPIENRAAFLVNTANLKATYPMYYASLQNRVSNVENDIQK